MTTFEGLAADYIRVWNETEPVRRRTGVATIFAEGARYTDPLMEAEGVDQIDAAIAAAQAQFPGWTFRLRGQVDGHHDQLRFGWELGPADSPAPIEGFDVAQLREGRFATVLGVLDRVPQQA